MNRQKLACTCENVTYGAIADAVAAGASIFAEVRARTGCGSGCGKCEEFITYLVRELTEERMRNHAE
jgi:bacterioferritin-associated ferredoxin